MAKDVQMSGHRGTSARQGGKSAEPQPVRAPSTSVDDANRALGILAASVLKRVAGVTIDSLRRDLETAATADEEKLSRTRWDGFLAGLQPLPDIAFRRLRDQLIAKVKALPKGHTLHADLRLMAPVLAELGTSRRELLSENDSVHQDREFFRMLNIKISDQKPESLVGLIGGFWFLIRYSTEESTAAGAASYNVSLLLVHELKYIRLSDRFDEYIVTQIPHFTLRSRHGVAATGAQSRVQAYRGRIVETSNTVNFVGNRKESAKIFTMNWWTPPRGGDDSEHAHEAYGIISTGSADDFSITGPVGACAVPESKNIREFRAKHRGEELGRSKELSSLIGDQGRGIQTLVGKRTAEELLEKVAPLCADPSAVARVLGELKHARERAAAGDMGGYYRARNV